MDYLNYVYPVMGIGGLIGLLFFAFRSGLNSMQQQAIAALKDRLDAQDREIAELKRENARLHQTQDTIISALKQKGMVVTIEGEMVTIEGPHGKSSTVRQKPPITKITKATPAQAQGKESEQP